MFSDLKNFILDLFKSRLFVLIIVFALLSSVLIQKLFVLQIVNGQDYLDNYKLMIKKTQQVQGTRGNIYDRNGEVLATNKLAYSVQIEDNGSYEDTDEKNMLINETINTVIEMVETNGDSVVNDFGIILNSENEYEFLYAEGTRRLRFLADIYGYATIDKLKEEEKNASPDDVMNFLCANKRGSSWGFGIDQEKYDKERVLKLVTVRYGMHLNSYQKYIPTTIASDVSDKTVAVVMENLSELQGISIGEESLRVYPDSKYFASLIGYTGKISQDEYDALSEEEQKRYSKTDIVGKAGIEKEMDSYLQGEKGKRTVYVDSLGKVRDSETNKEPQAGNNLYLSIDKELQITAYNVIEEKLAGIILTKMSNVLDYTRDPEGSSTNVIIPVGDIYYAFIGNEILDTRHFAQQDAAATEKAVYAAFCNRQERAISNIISNLSSAGSPAYKDLKKEMQAYMYYIASDLLTNKTNILLKDKIDTNNSVYKAWQNEEINLYEYLNHAIANNWIDTSVIQEYISTDEKYSDSNELYQGILTFLKDYLLTDTTFEKLIYKYMIKDGSITGAQICLMLFEQGVLPTDEDAINRLLSGYDAYSFIRDKIQKLEITPGQLGVEPSTGSLVMTETATGKTLACVSYPGYDNNRLANSMDVGYYNQLQVDLSKPFYNKATQEKTAPGSTFKMISSAAGLTEGIINSSSLINCNGPYKNISPNPKCWIYPGGHGSLNVVGAIANSCNCFYYDVGFRLGLSSSGEYSSDVGTDKIAKYAEMFGLGEVSGLEIPESAPQISDEDAVRTAIGQGRNAYTTSQLAKYVTGIANRGTVYNLTLLDRVEAVDGSLIEKFESTVYKEITEVSQASFDLIHQGMIQMVQKDTRFNKVRAGGIEMAGKTGTAQQSAAHADHVLFVGFAPTSNPEIALSVRITNGYNSGYAAEIGRDMVLKYFNIASDSELVTGQAASLGAASHGD